MLIDPPAAIYISFNLLTLIMLYYVAFHSRKISQRMDQVRNWPYMIYLILVLLASMFTIDFIFWSAVLILTHIDPEPLSLVRYIRSGITIFNATFKVSIGLALLVIWLRSRVSDKEDAE